MNETTLDIKDLLLAQKSNKEISRLLGISSQMVTYYRKKFNIRKTKKYEKEPLGKTKTRLLKTGLSREELTKAILKYQRKKENSSRTRHEFSVSFEDIKWNKICPILGIPIDYLCEGRTENSVSFDRIDSSKGYIKGNVHIVSWRANRIKNDGTYEEFKRIVNFYENYDLLTTCSVNKNSV